MNTLTPIVNGAVSVAAENWIVRETRLFGFFLFLERSRRQSNRESLLFFLFSRAAVIYRCQTLFLLFLRYFSQRCGNGVESPQNRVVSMTGWLCVYFLSPRFLRLQSLWLFSPISGNACSFPWSFEFMEDMEWKGTGCASHSRIHLYWEAHDTFLLVSHSVIYEDGQRERHHAQAMKSTMQST